jgi:hypothetical protein
MCSLSGDRKAAAGLWVIALVVVVLIGGEMVARFFLGLGTPPLSVAHPRIEYMFQPNQDIRRFGNQVLINQYGMRSEALPERECHRVAYSCIWRFGGQWRQSN